MSTTFEGTIKLLKIDFRERRNRRIETFKSRILPPPKDTSPKRKRTRSNPGKTQDPSSKKLARFIILVHELETTNHLYYGGWRYVYVSNYVN